MSFSRFASYSLFVQKFTLLLSCGLTCSFSGLQAQAELPEEVPIEKSGVLYSGKEGPWGKLTYYYVYLEAPDEYLAEYEVPNSLPKWTFHNSSPASLRALFESANLSQAFTDFLLDDANRVSHDGVVTIFPPIPDVEAMTPEQRATIYAELAKYPENEFQSDPVYFAGGSVEDWLKGCSLPEVVQEKILKMTYLKGSTLAFSDFSVLLNYVTGEDEVNLLLKALTRTRAMVVRLDVSQETDIDALSDYYTGRNRYKSILPFLRSVYETKEVTSFDLVHLLPSMARRYIYTYAPIEYSAYGRMPDCHWSSLNFFNHLPKQYFLDSRLSSETIVNNYMRVEGELQFGDIMMFIPDPQNGGVIHSCIHIADDIVFTKNGESILSPWILCKLSEVRAIYFPDNVGEVVAYRRKPQVQP